MHSEAIIVKKVSCLILTDSNKVCAELPKMNENPRTIVARGTSDSRVLLRLKINRQAKMIPIKATQTRTASSFATALPTSWKKNEILLSDEYVKEGLSTLRLATKAFLSL